MKNRITSRALALLATFAMTFCIPCIAGSAAPKPNIVFIVADDMGYADCGVHGSKEIPTPHIDSIAKAGVRFTDGYVTGPVCSPTRAALMTARYQHRDGVPDWVKKDSETGLAAGVPTIADYLRKAGYRTALIGKWHLGQKEPFHPMNRGFDEFFGLLGGGRVYFQGANEKGGKAKDGYAKLWKDREPADIDGYLTTEFGNEAAKFVASRKDSGAPFFLFLSFTAPHTPMMAPKELEEKFAHIENPQRRLYAAMMSSMDDAIGEVLAGIREAGLEKDTLVCFFSDNGGAITRNSPNGSDNTPYRGSKGEVWEGGVRVPMFAAWPTHLQAGTTFTKPVTQMDLAATALALAGKKPEEKWPIDGVNLMPFLDGKDSGMPHDSICWAYENRQWAIREGDLKVVAMSKQPKIKAEVKLYDLKADPSETTDLSASQPEKVSALTAKLLDWCRDVGAALPKLD
jgi:arylsulfatase A-like enzyme